MKKLTGLLIHLFFVCQTMSSTALNAQTRIDSSIIGIWLGKLIYPKYEKRIAIKISENGEDTPVAALISLDDGTGEMPVDSSTFNKDSLDIKLYDVEIKGKVNLELGTIESEFLEGSDKLRLQLKRIEKLPQYDKIKDLEVQPLSPEAFTILAEIFEYDRGIPLDARTIETNEFDGYSREKIVFSGVHDTRIPAYLAIPNKPLPPFPVVIAVHGLNSSKEVWWQKDSTHARNDSLASSLLKEGYAILTLDAPYHGERKAFNDFAPAGEITWKRNWYHKFRDFTIQAIIEHRRAIDYLETRSELDASRIGILGYSWGSIVAFGLTGLDSRIKTTVVCVLPISSWPSTLTGPYNFANKINGRPLLMLMGTDDINYTTENSKRVFELINSSDKDIVFYEGGHRLPPEYIEKAVNWFERNLR